jgi:hypothetical protein
MWVTKGPQCSLGSHGRSFLLLFFEPDETNDAQSSASAAVQTCKNTTQASPPQTHASTTKRRAYPWGNTHAELTPGNRKHPCTAQPESETGSGATSTTCTHPHCLRALAPTHTHIHTHTHTHTAAQLRAHARAPMSCKYGSVARRRDRNHAWRHVVVFCTHVCIAGSL